MLNARVEGVFRQPRRVVFDSEARLPHESRLFRSAAELPLIVVTSRAASRTATEALEAAGAEVIVASGENEAARVSDALDQLGERDIHSLLLEGGPHLAGAFFDAGEIDQLRAFVAPIVVGGRGARGPLEGQGLEEITAAGRALEMTCEEIEGDVLLSARLEEW
jgi:diaminohydroxyphosphoribosylaminopyrimidine deaminase/5-amino-6-(5-phosphoribosylamino)uracil reductase